MIQQYLLINIDYIWIMYCALKRGIWLWLYIYFFIVIDIIISYKWLISVIYILISILWMIQILYEIYFIWTLIDIDELCCFNITKQWIIMKLNKNELMFLIKMKYQISTETCNLNFEVHTDVEAEQFGHQCLICYCDK